MLLNVLPSRMRAEMSAALPGAPDPDMPEPRLDAGIKLIEDPAPMFIFITAPGTVFFGLEAQ